MPCFLVILALSVPRLVVALLYVFTDWFRGVLPDLVPGLPIVGILGFVFVPTTLLWYTAVAHWFHGVWGPWQIAGLVLALLMDVGPLKRKRG
jgi:hypothetical protein